MKFNSDAIENCSIIKEFKKNNPKFKEKNVYLCQSVDMDGNVVDEKYGVNLMTNNGLQRVIVNGVTIWNYYFYLGSGDTDPEYTNTQLNSYISALGAGAYKASWTAGGKSSDKPYCGAFEYDPVTKIQSGTQPLLQRYWDYTAGSNQEYYIREIALGTSPTDLFTHALIYDGLGNKSYIKKKPNTRLFITVYITFGVSFAEVPTLYDNGQYVLMNALAATRYMNGQGSSGKSHYMSCLTRYTAYKTNWNGSWYSLDNTTQNWYAAPSLQSGDVQKANLSYGAYSGNPFFWEDPASYATGMLFAPEGRWSSSTWELMNICGGSDDGVGIFTYFQMPEPEEMETYWATVANSRRFAPYNTNYRYNAADVTNSTYCNLSENFGDETAYTSKEWLPSSNANYNMAKYWMGRGTFPCSNFNITALKMYNWLTNEWDIDVNHHNSPNMTYDSVQHNYLYCRQYVHFDGVDKWVYVFVNPNLHGGYRKFSNTGVTICATDEYWDPSTYVKINDLSDIASQDPALMTKRYFIITSGSLAALSPSTVTWDNHRIIPHHAAFELPANVNDSPYAGSDTDIQNWTNVRSGCRPITNETDGWFLSTMRLTYLDSTLDTSNIKSYQLEIDGHFNKLSRLRRFATAAGDRILIFENYFWYDTTTGQDRYTTRSKAKNNFVIYTPIDRDTAPTSVELSLTFQDMTGDTNDTYHKYSWTDHGFLCAQNRNVNEIAIVDVYGNQDSNYEPIIYNIPNAKSGVALNLTDNCVYQDMAESTSTNLKFNIFDMKNQTIIDTFEINDNVAYTMYGIFGWREFIYVQLMNGSVHVNYLYDSVNMRLQQLSENFNFNVMADSNGFYYHLQQASINECLVLCSNAASGSKTYVIKASEPDKFYDLYDRTYVSDICGTHTYYPFIGTCNQGKQLLLTFMDYGNYSCIYDLGWFLNNGQIRHATYPSGSDNGYDRLWLANNGTSYANALSGCCFLYYDGFMAISGNINYEWTAYGKIWWQPIECKIPLYMKGTTTTINAYNNPIKWWGKSFAYSFTNNIAKYGE